MMRILASLFIPYFAVTCHSQDLPFIGMWEVIQVSVGNESMTPVSKWSQILPDGTYHAGNGWLRNSSGTWKYDPEKSQIEFIEKISLHDDAGPFQISISDDTMSWRREEEGMEVTVKLRKIDDLPMSTADLSTGLWAVKSYGEEGSTRKTNSGEKRTIFLRWDRIYIDASKSGRQTGIWHMNGHRPDLTLIPHEEEEENMYWKVSFSGNEMIWQGTGADNENSKISLTRMNQFP